MVFRYLPKVMTTLIKCPGCNQDCLIDFSGSGAKFVCGSCGYGTGTSVTERLNLIEKRLDFIDENVQCNSSLFSVGSLKDNPKHKEK